MTIYHTITSQTGGVHLVFEAFLIRGHLLSGNFKRRCKPTQSYGDSHRSMYERVNPENTISSSRKAFVWSFVLSSQQQLSQPFVLRWSALQNVQTGNGCHRRQDQIQHGSEPGRDSRQRRRGVVPRAATPPPAVEQTGPTGGHRRLDLDGLVRQHRVRPVWRRSRQPSPSTSACWPW